MFVNIIVIINYLQLIGQLNYTHNKSRIDALVNIFIT